MNDAQIKHLEFIQNVIGRMAQCSFLVKGWSITLVSALFALASKDTQKQYVLIAYFPAFMFWFLDGFYLYQERLYRSLYQEVVKGNAAQFGLDASMYKGGDKTWLASVFSKTRLLFHGVVVGTILIVMFAFS